LFFKRLVLTCQKQFQYERSISAVYYLIQGKQSIQTIQDAQLYGLTSYYGIFKNLKKEQFMQIITEMVQQKLLQSQHVDNYYTLTKKGKSWLQTNPVDHHYFQGFKYKQIDSIYFSRLLLLIQVLTNSKKRNYTYIPIIENDSIENWIKQMYSNFKNKLDYSLHVLYQELSSIFSQLPATYPSILLDQFTSYQTVGLTVNQIAAKYHLRVEDISIITTNVIHFILTTIQNQPNNYSFLYFIGKDLFSIKNLTNSAKKTKELLHQGQSIPQIALARNLKVNTIYDHIVEIALQDDHFPLSQYVSEKTQEQIMEAIEQTQSYKLKTIKEVVGETISYFQIRLVLAKLTKFVDGRIVK